MQAQRGTVIRFASVLVMLAVGLFGCNGATPSGLNAQGAGGSSGGSTGGGSKGGGQVRIVAWKLDDVLPIQQSVVWMFLADPGNLDLNTLDVQVAGQSVSQGGNYQVNGMQLNKGLMLQIDPAPPAGETIEVSVDDTSGNKLRSNVITVQAGPFAGANLPPSASPNGTFQISDPKYGDTGTGAATFISFQHANPVASYQVVVMQIDPNQGSIQDIPVAVEMPAPGALTCGTTPSGGIEMANTQLPVPGDFIVHVVALDASGWGIGTSVDVAGYNNLPPGLNSSNITQQQLQVINTWPYFTSN